MSRSARPLSSFRTAAARVHERAEIVEAVGRDQAGCHEFPESFFHFRRKMVGHPHQVGKEARTSLLQGATQILRHGTQLGKRVRPLRCGIIVKDIPQPLALLTWEETNRRHTRRDNPTSFKIASLRKPWMRRQPAPADCPAQTEPVQPLRLILRQPRAEQMRLPGRGCRFEAGQLHDDVQETSLAMETRPRRDMLPLK